MVVSCWLLVGPRNGRVRVLRILYHGRRVRAGTLKPSNESKSAVADCRCQEGSSEPSKLGRRPSRHRHPTGSCLVARTRKAAFAASRNFTKKQRRAERKTTGKESARCEVRGCEYRLAGGLFREPVGQTVFATEARRSVKVALRTANIANIGIGTWSSDNLS